MENINVTEKKITSKTAIGEKTVVIENIKYPFFESEDKKSKELCNKMNAFYEAVAKKYSAYARNAVVKKIRKSLNTCKIPVCMGMKYQVSFCSKKVISVVLDLSFSEGKKVKMKRFSQMWNCENKCIISVGNLLDLSMKNKKNLLEKVVEKAVKESENVKKEYFNDTSAKVRKNFCFNNSFAAPLGMVFFFDAGILRAEKYGACCFVVPYNEIKDMLKEQFLTGETSENDDL